MSLSQIAQQVGVSTSTVTRYVRGELKVAPATARRIDRALAENGHPAAARTTTVSTIGLVVRSLDNPYFSSLADAVVDAAVEDGIDVLTSLTGSSAARERKSVERLAQLPHLGGIIYLGMHSTNEAFTGRVGGDLPVVLLDEYVNSRGTNVAQVTADSFGGAYQATAHLIGLGHTAIAHLGGPRGLHTADQREAGYRAALADRGIEPDERLIVRGTFTSDFGSNVFAHLSAAGRQPTAVFCASDIIAIGVLEAARQAGIAVPETLSVIGCDGITVGEWLTPRLTTVAQPTTMLARQAVDELVGIATGAAPTTRTLPMTLKLRASTAPPA
ncbi:LacI family transcriptional regulator [Microbacterium resistens]|uniref:LacI family transcriptional regulator n=1 Tax=Microbacterium resistens TaxID=156977 RepID=A0ABY3RTA9_9MICO|nr:LacI family DNA-binding transcriptional regulator [Microbacterium resistens]UGS27027.1 LacI family transcriptional regulator [Microbacterium resistens]